LDKKLLNKKLLGLFGGTFDPIHCGHMEVAHLALNYLKLDELLFIPAGDPYLKSDTRKITDPRTRLEMIELAINDEGEKKFSSSDVEIKRKGPSYTLETVIKYKKDGIKTIVILGIDSILSMSKWKNPEALIKESNILAITRPGTDLTDFYNMNIKGIHNSVEVLKVDTPDITASNIRNRIKSQLDVKNMLSPSVENFIKAKKLYCQ